MESDATCAGGAYVVTSDQTYQPALNAAVPNDLPPKIFVCVRRMGSPVSLKTITNDTQRELAWDWNKPGEFL